MIETPLRATCRDAPHQAQIDRLKESGGRREGRNYRDMDCAMK